MQRFLRVSILLALIVLAAWLWFGRLDSTRPTIVEAAESDQLAVLVSFGVDDDQPRDWSGEIRVENGRVIGLDPW